MKYVVFTLLMLSVANYTNIQTALLTIIALLLICGIMCVIDISDRKRIISLYFITFLCSVIYVLLCNMYMRNHGYSYLLAYDTDNIILPTLKDFLNADQNLFNIILNIWSDYSFFDRFQTGYYTYMSIWGWIAKTYNCDFYYTIQLSHLTVGSLSPVLIYKMLNNWISEKRIVYIYSLIIGLSSILFYYYNTILRDTFICVLMLYIFNICIKKFSYNGLLKISVALFVITTFRIETGLLCTIFVPVYCLSTSKGDSTIFKICIGLVVLLCVSLFAYTNYFDDIHLLYQNNYEAYSEGVSEGRGIIGSLQRLPLIIGDFLSILYTAVNPIPCWVKLFDDFNPLRPECYNIMNFPMIPAVFFNTYIIIYLLDFLTRRKCLVLNNMWPLYMLMLPAAIFLILQSAVVAQRRIMGVYVLFYVLWAIVHFNSPERTNKKILLYSVAIFTLLQFVYIFI